MLELAAQRPDSADHRGKLTVLASGSPLQEATHVVVPDEAPPRRTLRVLFGLVRGAWLLRPSWVQALLEQGADADETQHVADVWQPPSCPAGAQRRSQLLRGLSVHVGTRDPPPAQVRALVAECGGTRALSAEKADLRIVDGASGAAAAGKQSSAAAAVAAGRRSRAGLEAGRGPRLAARGGPADQPRWLQARGVELTSKWLFDCIEDAELLEPSPSAGHVAQQQQL